MPGDSVLPGDSESVEEPDAATGSAGFGGSCMVASTGTGEGVTGGADVGLCFRGKGVGPGSGVGARPEFDAWRSASLGYGVPGAGDRVFGDQLRLRARAEGAAASGFELGRGFEVGSLDVQIFFADVTRSVAFSQIPFLRRQTDDGSTLKTQMRDELSMYR